jgi:chromate transport protein ChrA
MKVLTEAFVAGIIILIIGLVIAFIMNLLQGGNAQYSNWGWIAFLLFVTGFVAHLVSEYTGLNKNYCKHGNACKAM